MGLFNPEPSLEEIEEKTEREKAKGNLVKSRRERIEDEAAIKELEKRMGKGSRKFFSSIAEIKQWLKNH